MINTEGRRGFVVVDPRQDVEVVYEIRKRLEGLAARLAADHITVPQLQNLDGIMEEMWAMVDAADIDENRDRIAELNHTFHIAINEASGSARLVALIEQLAPIYRSRRLVRYYSPETLRNSHNASQDPSRAVEPRRRPCRPVDARPHRSRTALHAQRRRRLAPPITSISR